MMHLVNRNTMRNEFAGFSLIEVMLALFIVGSVLTSIFLLQQRITDSVTSYATSWQSIILMKKRMKQSVFDRAKEGLYGPASKKSKETIGTPPITITYELIKPPKGSALEKFPSIMIESIRAQWDEWYGKREEKMVSFLYRPEQKKS